MSKVRIVVATKNNETIIQDCLEHIYAQKFKDFLCCVVDDGSTDKTLSIVQRDFPQTKVYQCTESKGPAYNRNVALSDADEDFIVFMDSDAFIKNDWLEQAVSRMEKDEKVGLIGGKVYHGKTSRIQSAGGEFHCGGVCWLVGCEENDEPAQVEEAHFFHLPSSTFMMRSCVAKEIGGFDEDYCYLYEDLDICWRVWLAGYIVLYWDKLVSEHLLSTTSKKEFTDWKRQYMSKRNKMITLLKNYELGSLLRYLPFILGVQIAEFALLKPRSAIFFGNLYPLFRPKMIWKKRKDVQGIRKISDTDMRHLLTTNHFLVVKMCLANFFGRK